MIFFDFLVESAESLEDKAANATSVKIVARTSGVLLWSQRVLCCFRVWGYLFGVCL